MEYVATKDGKNYIVTPQLRFVKTDEGTFLEQCYLEKNVLDPKALKAVWVRVPVVDEEKDGS